MHGVPLYAGFAATGVCCALIGVLLPALIVEWHLDDHGAGLIFLFIWLGSSLGALLVTNVLKVSIILGSAAVAVASFALAFLGQQISSPLMLLYGAGLGLTMTSISLLRQQVMHRSRSVELVRLNLMWAIGACVCPLLVSHALRSGSTRSTFLAVATAFLVLSISSIFVVTIKERLTRSERFVLPSWTIFRAVPARLILTTVLATGIEASAGSWLAAYAHRSQPGILFTVAAPTCLWAGLLASRSLGSFAAVERKMRQKVWVLLALVLLSTVALVIAVHGSALLIASLLLGFGLGPLYPVFLARVLAYQQGGAIFFLAGVSSAVMPWLTGLLSSRTRSLNIGLLVPAVGALILLLLGSQSTSADKEAIKE